MANPNSRSRLVALTLAGRNDERTLPPPASLLSPVDTKGNNCALTPFPPPTPTPTPPPSRPTPFNPSRFSVPSPSNPSCPTPSPSPPLSQRSSCSTLLDSHLIAQRTILLEKLERLRVSFERGIELQRVDLRERRGYVERMVWASGDAGGDGKRREWWVREGRRLEGMVCVLSSAGWREMGRGMMAEGDGGGTKDGVGEKDGVVGKDQRESGGGEDSGYSDGERI